jgi:hypothetical protein
MAARGLVIARHLWPVVLHDIAAERAFGGPKEPQSAKLMIF